MLSNQNKCIAIFLAGVIILFITLLFTMNGGSSRLRGSNDMMISNPNNNGGTNSNFNSDDLKSVTLDYASSSTTPMPTIIDNISGVGSVGVNSQPTQAPTMMIQNDSIAMPTSTNVIVDNSPTPVLSMSPIKNEILSNSPTSVLSLSPTKAPTISQTKHPIHTLNQSGPWSQCLGINGNECSEIIKIQTASNPVDVYFIEEGFIVTSDWVLTRVRIYIDEDNIVTRVPHRG